MAVVLLLKGDLDHAEDLLHNSNSILNKIHMDETVRLNSKGPFFAFQLLRVKLILPTALTRR
jgi:hypothetical protein